MQPNPSSPRAWGTVCFAGIVASAISAALYLVFGDVNLNMSDEGYLWVGVLGVLDGMVPFRDFQSYDPGRYYWCAWGAEVFGSGILGVRASMAVFQAIGFTLGLLVLRRFVSHAAWILPGALLLALWFYPRHKVMEPAIAMGVTWFVVRLIEKPSLGRHVACGVCVGLVAWFGRNHGLYAGVASLLALGFLQWKQPTPGVVRRGLGLAGGVVVGYSPLLVALVVVDGFAAAFWNAILDLLTKGANIPRAYPWPWRESYGDAQGIELVTEVASTLAFLIPVVILPWGVWRVLRVRRGDVTAHAGLVGTTLVALLYIHHVSVRSDAPHLAQCIHPTLLVALALGQRRWQTFAITGVLLVVTFFATFRRHPTLKVFPPWGPAPDLVETEIAGETLRMLRAQHNYMRRITNGVARRLAPGDDILVAPSRPTLYGILGKHPPIPQIYMFWFAPEEEQREIVRALEEKEVRWVLLVDQAVDQREDLRFPNTYPIVFQHVLDRYEKVETQGMRSNHVLFRRRGG
jgi:hypothetical protein